MREANRYFDAAAPWTLKKTGDLERMAAVLAVSHETLRCVAVAYQPFMPRASAKMLDLLGVPEGEARQFAALGGAGVPAGTTLPKPAPVFPRVEIEE